MSKLCNCKQNFIRNEIFSYGPTNTIEEATDLTELLTKILESDCVCEKKDKVRTPSDKCLHGYELTEPCKHCMWDERYEKEKKSHTGEKKEECRHGNRASFCSYCFAADSLLERLKEKQSQSPCEHEWWKMNNMVFERVLTDRSAYWNYEDGHLFNCFKCGLVTCKNPSGSSINQNPNVST